MKKYSIFLNWILDQRKREKMHPARKCSQSWFNLKHVSVAYVVECNCVSVFSFLALVIGL